MSYAMELIEQIESCGGVLALKDDDRIVYELPEEMESLVEQLREKKLEVVEVLRRRKTIPAMPHGVRLISWNVKQGTVLIETASVVVNPHRFAVVTLEQLERAMRTKRWTGWSIPQLLDRLAQVGVAVELVS